MNDSLEIRVAIEGEDLVVRLLGNDGQGSYSISEDSISVAKIKAALDRYEAKQQG